MDDGSKKSNSTSYYLCTDSFTEEDVHDLGAKFLKTWGIKVGYHKKGKGKRIYIPVEHSEKFRKTIEKYVLDSFKYKLHL
jgi:hypothetical protein